MPSHYIYSEPFTTVMLKLDYQTSLSFLNRREVYHFSPLPSSAVNHSPFPFDKDEFDESPLLYIQKIQKSLGYRPEHICQKIIHLEITFSETYEII